MKNKILILTIIILAFVIILIPLKGSYAFYSDNKDLDIINTKVGDWKTLLGYLRINDKNNNLSPTTQGDMYRYQGTDNVANWICFGTSDLSKCTDETDNDGNNIPDGIDKYMYRIIGITEEGELKLIKETFIKEGENIEFSWNDKYSVDSTSAYYCSNGICPEWPNSLLFKRINGISNGKTQGKGTRYDDADTDIFIDSNLYDYLKSGDSYNGTKDEKGSSWYQLIESHDWMYGDIRTTNSSTYGYNGQYLYEIETGKADVKHTVGTDGNIEEQTYRWFQKTLGKISLMYIHDYYFAYYDGLSEESRGKALSLSELKKSWIHYQKDDYNNSIENEWLLDKLGVRSTDNAVAARCIASGGQVGDSGLANSWGVRPVFYLNSEIQLEGGTGTKTDPFIILEE